MLESKVNDPSSKIAGVMGINKAGDIQYVFMPTSVPKALNNCASVVLGNSTDISNEPALVYFVMLDLGFTSVIKTFVEIPDELRPQEHLPKKFFKGTNWETAKVPLGLVCLPVIAPTFFGMKTMKTSIYNLDFEDKLGSLSNKHLQWAKLIKENVSQQENDGRDDDKII